MKQVYVGHSNSFDFKEELYEPLKDSELSTKVKLIFPHENSSESFNSREKLKECSAMVAEVTYPSTGLGIELAWAESYGVPIYLIFRKGEKISKSLRVIPSNLIEYESNEDLIEKLKRIL